VKARYAGIDVSAKSLTVAVESDGEPTMGDFENTPGGHRQLCRFLAKRKVTRVVAEPTSNYGLDAMIALTEGGFEVMAANPRAAASFAKASMRRGKTDKVDARLLLAFGRSMPFVSWRRPTPSALEFRALTRRLQDLVEMGAAEKARLHALNATSTTPEVVLASVRANIERLEQLAEELVTLAVESLQRDEKLAFAFALLTGIRGIANRTAVKLLGELAFLPEDLEPRQIVAIAGLDPRPRESGTMMGRRRISKHGNARLRGALFMAALNTARWEPVVGAYYAELSARNKHHMVAMIAVMRKLLHSIYGMLKTKTAFDPMKFRSMRTELQRSA
jgi:transposase